ncbi:hypothetical protein JI747_015765 [Chryseobacterium sp. RG1]|uniref:Tetratricopeptide repeat-containing protein n=1 Tax=Chryseobacterium tagetis TaxID=2801334 RepID=A0ABS8A3W5_9FLAO|nr:DUF6584 family protein [Chryseobacterium tagetis]MCA6068638.1 hypothetical protein [Chryseobacterium tagetis]
MEDIFNRIEKDLNAGRKKKACDRLRNLINEFPDDISLREKLAQIYYDSGFKDEAGKFWILSEIENFEMKEAIEMYRNTFSNSGNAILKDIVFRGDKDKLSNYAKNILKELESDSYKKTKHIPDFKRKRREKGTSEESKDSFLNTVKFYLVIGGMILLLVLGLVKLYDIIGSIFFK